MFVISFNKLKLKFFIGIFPYLIKKVTFRKLPPKDRLNGVLAKSLDCTCF